MPKSRTEAFSDGVFAIAITLLIIEVRVPDSKSGELARDLANQWPSYAAYLVSFVIIGIIWVNHHDIFERITTVDRPLLFLNLLLLLTVAFLPFPTALLGQYIRQGDNAHIAAAVYGANMTLIGLAFIAVWTYLARVPSLLEPEMGAEGAAAGTAGHGDRPGGLRTVDPAGVRQSAGVPDRLRSDGAVLRDRVHGQRRTRGSRTTAERSARKLATQRLDS